MAANYNRPKPVDQLAWRRHCILRVHCACGRQAEAVVKDLIEMLRLPGQMRFHELIARLRCSECGERPAMADVVQPGRRR